METSKVLSAKRRFLYVLTISSLFIGAPLAVSAVASLTWTSTTAGTYVYSDIATSNDGQKVLAVTFNTSEKVMYSANAGSTWTNIAPTRSTGTASSFGSVSISGDGSVAYIAVSQGGPASGSKVYKTTNFSTWTQISTGDTVAYATVATNSDGSVVAIGNTSTLKVSIDGGATFPYSTAVAVWGCDMSDLGDKIMCYGDMNTIKYSSNYGATFTSKTGAGSRNIEEAAGAISGDGQVMYAVWADYGAALEGKSKVYKSTNGGTTWTEITANLPEAAINATTGARNYGIVATNSDGSVVLVGSRGPSTLAPYYQYGYLYLSDDSGATWTKQTGSGSAPWASVAVNANGSKLYANVGEEGYTVTGAVKSAGLAIISTSSFNSIGTSGGLNFATYRTSIQLSANVSAAGKVTFFADGKRIAGCIKKATSGTSPNIVATCTYSPSRRGAVIITAQLFPTDSLVTGSTSNRFTMLVSNRSTNR